MNLSFAGCGFHGIYHIGVISCLRRHGKNIMKDVSRYGGASAGSLVAALLATSTPLEHGLKFTMELSTKVRTYFLGALNPSFDLMQHLDDELKRYLPQDAHKRASGRLYVSLSRFPRGENSIVSQFESRDDLIQVLLASCYIPIYGGTTVPIYKGQKWFDGGFSDNLPIFKTGKTIRVSPFSGDFDICPEDENSYNLFTAELGKNMNVVVNLQNMERGFRALFPSSRNDLQKIYKHGYNDALKFLGVFVSK